MVNFVYLCNVKTEINLAQARIETIKQTEEIGLFTIRFEGDIATEFEKFANKFKDDAKRQAALL